MLIDHAVMSLVFGLSIALGTMYGGALHAQHVKTNFNVFTGVNCMMAVAMAAYLCKDSIDGRSVAKRIMKLQVVDNETGKIASPIKCLLRNITVFIWPVEVIVAGINTERRIGDRIAGTKVVPFNADIKQSPTQYKSIIVALAAAWAFIMGIILLLWYFHTPR